MNKRSILGAGLVLSAILSACPGPTPTPAEQPGKSNEMIDDLVGLLGTAQRVASTGNDKAISFGKDLTPPVSGPSSMALSLKLLAEAALNPASSAKLAAKVVQDYIAMPFPKGKSVYDAQGKLVSTEQSDDLDITWVTKTGKTGHAVLDYTGEVKILTDKLDYPETPGAAPTTHYRYAIVPEKMIGTVTVGDTLVASLNFQGTAQASDTPGVSLGFNSVVISAKVLELDGSKTLLDMPNFTYKISDTSLKTSGDIKYANGDDTVESKWDISIGGEVNAVNAAATNGYTSPMFSYFPTGFLPKGAGSVSVSNSLNGAAVGVSFKITDWTYNSVFNGKGFVTAVKTANVTDGKLLVKSKTATFSGSLGDDANGNCVIGDDLNMVFSDGTKTLEQVLLDSKKVTPSKCGPQPTPFVLGKN
jgi:hypothetical protein